jgi:hypothetical protein
MPASVDRSARRLSIPLDPEHAARLARLARLAGVPDATLARGLLSKAIEEADSDAGSTTAILDGIPGAYEHAMQSLGRADAGEAIALDDL